MNAVQPSWLDALLAATLTHTIKAAMLGPGYTYSSAHTAPSDLTDVLGTATLTGLTSTGGVLDADDSVVTAPTVESMTSVFVYDFTTSKLMIFFDTGVGFLADPNGNVSILWPQDANVKIFPLGGKP
jgi:hypothetical protein